MNQFKVGDRIRLARTHTYLGISYTQEAGVGDVGRIDRVNKNNGKVTSVHIIWDDSPARTSNADVTCLELEVQPVTDEELAQVYRSLGVQP